jgi:asparagine N-glycosylation enzyme membrane subunit Stt3
MPAPCSRSWSYVAILLLVVLVSWTAREASHLRLEFAPGSGFGGEWFSVDSDGLYHLRRIERFRAEGGLPAASDPYLNYPKGAVVPWPPYYTMVASSLVADSGTRLDLEHAVSELPLVFAMITSLLAAFCGGLFAGRRGALLAGLMHALSYGSVHYSTPGVADHHAWVSLLATLLLVLFALVARQGVLRDTRFAGFVGAFCGMIAGVLLGSWVGAVLYVLPLQLALAWWLVVKRERSWRGLASFAIGFHVLAAATLGPAVLSSPWRFEHPWMVVNLSWFHLAWLGIGALVFVPPLFLSTAAARRRYPAVVLTVGAVFGGLLLLLDVGPGPGIREGFDWASRADQFMSGIAESAPLWGSDHFHSGGFARWIGFGVLLLPAAMWSAWRAIRGGSHMLVPFLVAVPLLALQAFAQRRFADALAAPLAILVAWALVRWWPRLRLPRRSLPAALAVAAVFAIGLQAPSVIHAARRAGESRLDDVKSAERLLFEWLGARSDQPQGDAARSADGFPVERRGAVMAAWDFGHVIEWAARRPSIATNFGTYIGVDSFRDPARFFMAEDPAVAEQVLRDREVRYVVTTARFQTLIPTLVKALDDGRRLSDFQQVVGGKGVQLLPRWYGTVGAMLYDIGDMDGPDGPAAPLDFLRLVHMSPMVVDVPRQLGGKQAVGRIWEHVPGARLISNVGAGVEMEVEVYFELRDRKGQVIFTGRWIGRQVGDDSGFARVRVPYNSGRNGDNYVTTIRWGTGEDMHVVDVPESAVLAGDSLILLQ